MNASNFEHAFESLLGMVVLAAILGMIFGFTPAAMAGAAIAPIGFFLGREHAQYEYKLIKKKNMTFVGDLKPWEGFAFFDWSLDSKLDLLFPVIGNSIAYAVLLFFVL